MGNFDCADATNQVSRRLQTVTTLQALSLLNNPFVFEQSECFARRVNFLQDKDYLRGEILASDLENGAPRRRRGGFSRSSSV